jgi:hypothetical protein
MAMPRDVGAEPCEDAAAMIDASVPAVAVHPVHREATSPAHPGHLSCSEKVGVKAPRPLLAPGRR